MSPATELHLLSPQLVFWHAHDPASKSELFSTAAVDNRGRILVVDPIPLAPGARTELLRLGAVQAIAVTNANHWRATDQFCSEFKAPVFGRAGAAQHVEAQVEPASRLQEVFAGLAVIPIEGAVQSEMALHLPQGAGTLIVGDSLIHFDPYGLALLPKKYCVNQPEMRRSLRQLLAPKSSRIFFAHGLPILNNVMSRLESLLE